MTSVSSLTPHVVLSMDPMDSGHVALVNHAWCLRPDANDAFVFPTRRLAQRYADFLGAEYVGTFQVEAAPLRISHLPHRDACFFCGCVQSFACPGGCSWTHPDTLAGLVDLRLCSTCMACLRAELETEHANRPVDPMLGNGLSLGEGIGQSYGADAFNAEMARSGDRHQAEHLSRIAAGVVHAIARLVEGAH